MRNLLSLFFLFNILTLPLFAENKEVSVQIIKVSYIVDEYEPEIIITLDNGIKIIAGVSDGNFFAGQKVAIILGDDQLILTTYNSDGSESGKMIFFRLGPNSHFYTSI